jgi:hypothetical protein
VPKEVPAGIVPDIIPALVLAMVPIFTGAVKLPEASLNSAVKIFPALNVPDRVKGTLTAPPSHSGLEILPVIGCAEPNKADRIRATVNVFFIAKGILLNSVRSIIVLL